MKILDRADLRMRTHCAFIKEHSFTNTHAYGCICVSAHVLIHTYTHSSTVNEVWISEKLTTILVILDDGIVIANIWSCPVFGLKI